MKITVEQEERLRQRISGLNDDNRVERRAIPLGKLKRIVKRVAAADYPFLGKPDIEAIVELRIERGRRPYAGPPVVAVPARVDAERCLMRRRLVRRNHHNRKGDHMPR